MLKITFSIIFALTMLINGCSMSNKQPIVSMDSINPPPTLIDSAFFELFGFTDKEFERKFGALSIEHQDLTKTAKDKATGIWFNQSFNFKNDRLHVVFFKTQLLNEAGKIDTCHICAPEISEATFQFTSSGWKLISKKLNFETFGSWGDAPYIKQADILELSAGISAFMIPFSYSMQGETDSGVGLFEFNGIDWKYIGYIHLEYSTEGSYSEFNHSGKLSKLAGNNPKYPDLFIKFKGTEKDYVSGKIIPAKDALYYFDGSKYISKDRPD